VAQHLRDGGDLFALGDELPQLVIRCVCGEVDRVGDAGGNQLIADEATIGAHLELGDRDAAVAGLAQDVVGHPATAKCSRYPPLSDSALTWARSVRWWVKVTPPGGTPGVSASAIRIAMP
jgi:hypothetical protein